MTRSQDFSADMLFSYISCLGVVYSVNSCIYNYYLEYNLSFISLPTQASILENNKKNFRFHICASPIRTCRNEH